ncbi:cytoskeleton protein RodZ [Cydia fagiglandana]|uniref:cytoskeleton protein RodZ n=1 Tax=Cydia fagiglandana TaxID=1458189 RepID=UPI002FEE54EC
MCAKSILLLFSILSTYVDSASFDQRQTGNLNVQVDLKDIQIIALMKGGKEEYVDYDYAYDYSEMTIRPQNGSTTPRPLNATTDAENDSTTVADLSTETIKNDTWLSAETTPAPTVASQQDTFSSTEKSTEATASSPPIPNNDKNITVTQTSSNSTECKKGFILNVKGDCELKLQGTGNALLKLVKLSQRLKLKRENRRNQNHST